MAIWMITVCIGWQVYIVDGFINPNSSSRIVMGIVNTIMSIVIIGISVKELWSGTDYFCVAVHLSWFRVSLRLVDLE